LKRLHHLARPAPCANLRFAETVKGEFGGEVLSFKRSNKLARIKKRKNIGDLAAHGR